MSLLSNVYVYVFKTIYFIKEYAINCRHGMSACIYILYFEYSDGIYHFKLTLLNIFRLSLIISLSSFQHFMITSLMTQSYPILNQMHQNILDIILNRNSLCYILIFI